MCGDLPHAATLQAIARSDLMLRTTSYDGDAISVREALHLGTPVVAINSMSRHHMKDHELHAFWGEALDVIRTKLLDRISDSAERERLAETLSLQAA